MVFGKGHLFHCSARGIYGFLVEFAGSGMPWLLLASCNNVCSFLKIMKGDFPFKRAHLYCYLKIQNGISGGDLIIPVFERFTCFSNNTFG